MITATQIRVRDILLLDGQLMSVLKVDHITPGKGNAVVQTDLRNVRTGIKTNRRFRSTEGVEKAYLTSREMQYLYSDGDHYIFMDTANYEQIGLSKDALGDGVNYLKENAPVTVTFYEQDPIGVELPGRVTFKIVECDPPMKTATKTAISKPAKLENGLVVKVPSYLGVGQEVVVDTTTGNYLERA